MIKCVSVKACSAAAQYGEDAVKEGMGGGGGAPGGMGDLFDILSGGRGGGGRQRERRGENVVHRLKVSLEEIYNGGTRCGMFPAQGDSLMTWGLLLCSAVLPAKPGQSAENADRGLMRVLNALGPLQEAVASAQCEVRGLPGQGDEVWSAVHLRGAPTCNFAAQRLLPFCVVALELLLAMLMWP